MEKLRCAATFFDFPAEHWKHLRTTNVIESPFATVRLRERATRGAGSRTRAQVSEALDVLIGGLQAQAKTSQRGEKASRPRRGP